MRDPTGPVRWAHNSDDARARRERLARRHRGPAHAQGQRGGDEQGLRARRWGSASPGAPPVSRAEGGRCVTGADRFGKLADGAPETIRMPQPGRAGPGYRRCRHVLDDGGPTSPSWRARRRGRPSAASGTSTRVPGADGRARAAADASSTGAGPASECSWAPSAPRPATRSASTARPPRPSELVRVADHEQPRARTQRPATGPSGSADHRRFVRTTTSWGAGCRGCAGTGCARSDSTEQPVHQGCSGIRDPMRGRLLAGPRAR